MYVYSDEQSTKSRFRFLTGYFNRDLVGPPVCRRSMFSLIHIFKKIRTLVPHFLQENRLVVLKKSHDRLHFQFQKCHLAYKMDR